MSKLTFKQFIISESDVFTELQNTYLKSIDSKGNTNEMDLNKKSKKKKKINKNYDPKLFNPKKWNEFLQWTGSAQN